MKQRQRSPSLLELCSAAKNRQEPARNSILPGSFEGGPLGLDSQHITQTAVKGRQNRAIEAMEAERDSHFHSTPNHSSSRAYRSRISDFQYQMERNIHCIGRGQRARRYSRTQTVPAVFKSENIEGSSRDDYCPDPCPLLPDRKKSRVKASNSQPGKLYRLLCEEISQLDISEGGTQDKSDPPMKGMNDRECRSCFHANYPREQECMRNLAPCSQFQPRNKEAIRNSQVVRSPEQTQTNLHQNETGPRSSTQRGQRSTIAATTPILTKKRYTRNTASRASASTSRWISNQMIPLPGYSRQSLQRYETDLSSGREWSNSTIMIRQTPLQNYTRERPSHTSQNETTQRRRSQSNPNMFLQETREERCLEYPMNRRNAVVLETDTTRRDRIFSRVLQKRF